MVSMTHCDSKHWKSVTQDFESKKNLKKIPDRDRIFKSRPIENSWLFNLKFRWPTVTRNSKLSRLDAIYYMICLTFEIEHFKKIWTPQKWFRFETEWKSQDLRESTSDKMQKICTFWRLFETFWDEISRSTFFGAITFRVIFLENTFPGHGSVLNCELDWFHASRTPFGQPKTPKLMIKVVKFETSVTFFDFWVIFSSLGNYKSSLGN